MRSCAQKSGSYSRRSIRGELEAQGCQRRGDRRARSARPSIDDDVALLALWQRRFGAAPANDREKARQVRFLQARGFALSAILRLLRARCLLAMPVAARLC